MGQTVLRIWEYVHGGLYSETGAYIQVWLTHAQEWGLLYDYDWTDGPSGEQPQHTSSEHSPKPNTLHTLNTIVQTVSALHVRTTLLIVSEEIGEKGG